MASPPDRPRARSGSRDDAASRRSGGGARGSGSRQGTGGASRRAGSARRGQPTNARSDRGRSGRQSDDAGAGGFGPYGPPSVPERERRPDEEPRERRPAPLRVRGKRPTATDDTRRQTGRARASAPDRSGARRRRGRPPEDVEREILRLGGRRGPYLLREVMDAADAYAHQRDREALRRLRPVRDAIPDAATVRELLGLVHYRLGNYRAAAAELSRFVELTDGVEQHPVLMDCFRAQKRWTRVDELWDELATASPSGALVTEGRIVAAGALADRGRLEDAIAVLDRKAADVRRPKPHHLRLWYALADLEERSGNHARARSLFDRIAGHDRDFADVGARRAALG